jgi:hypothetical protein
MTHEEITVTQQQLIALNKNKVISRAKLNLAKNPRTSAQELMALVGIEIAIDRQLAKHSKASDEMLRVLANNPDSIVQKNIILNPNISSELFIQLAPIFPTQFYKNPIISNDTFPILELIAVLPEKVIKSLIRKPECPLSMFDWAVENGDDSDRLNIAKHFKLPERIRIVLAKDQNPQVAKAANRLRLDEGKKLIGKYPKVLDYWDARLNEAPWNYSLRESLPDIIFADSSDVEVIQLPVRGVGLDYVVIENLPNLRELHVYGKATEYGGYETVQWLICKNLPSLEVITIQGGVRWLQIETTPKLTKVDVSNASTLDHFSIHGNHSLQEINTTNCKKLRQIEGLSHACLQILKVDKQITANQKQSKRKGQIYSDMTFTDIDQVLSIINQGFRRVGEQGVCENWTQLSIEKPNGNLFDLRLLCPMESVYTGGTGEIYSYAVSTAGSEMGFSTAEGCLKDILEYLIGIDELGVLNITSRKNMLEYLTGFVQK